MHVIFVLLVSTVQKLLVKCPNNEDDDDGNGSESSATNPICEEKFATQELTSLY